jgi:hypothetical protein
MSLQRNRKRKSSKWRGVKWIDTAMSKPYKRRMFIAMAQCAGVAAMARAQAIAIMSSGVEGSSHASGKAVITSFGTIAKIMRAARATR